MDSVFNIDWQQFHFIRPYWLWGIMPALLLPWLLKRFIGQQSGWRDVLPAHLQSVLLEQASKPTKGSALPFIALSLAMIIAVTALAGPAWERLPQPVYNLKKGSVLVLDMSLSMRATDVTPDRLTRARFKAIDMVSQLTDGEVGMVAYAGDAFVISPLTEDANNLVNLIPSVSPEIMPIPGSEPLRGFEVAAELLENAGYMQGDIFWFTDGIEQAQFAALSDFVRTSPYTIHTFAVGTQDGAPIRQINGELLKSPGGAIVIPRLEPSRVRAVSSRSGGAFARMTTDDSDIQTLLAAQRALEDRMQQQESEDTQLAGDVWQDMGIYLVVLLLPIAAYAFRRGIVFVLPWFLFSNLYSTPVEAQESAPNAIQEIEQQWFKTADQRGQIAYEKQDYGEAAQQFNDPMWRGAAHYRNGNYEAALQAFSGVETTDSLYNQGNSLAKLGRLQEAIDAYDTVIQNDPGHQQAIDNKALLEKLLQQQEQQDQSNNNQQSDQDNSDEQSSEGEQNQSDDSASEDPEQSQQDSEQQSGTESEGDASQDDKSDNAQQEPSEGESEMRENEMPPPSEQESQDQSEQQNQMSQSEQSPTENQSMQGQQSEELTDEEREQLQRIESLLRKIPDDPAYLLQRKMLLESQQRRRERAPPQQQQNW